jgi:hypothetical protein
LVYSNELRVMLMFPSGGDFFDMNRLVDFWEIPDFQHNQPTNIAWWFGMEVNYLVELIKKEFE